MPKKKTAGRPRKANSDLRRPRPLKCSDREWRKVQAAAKAEHMNVADYIRSRIVPAAVAADAEDEPLTRERDPAGMIGHSDAQEPTGTQASEQPVTRAEIARRVVDRMLDTRPPACCKQATVPRFIDTGPNRGQIHDLAKDRTAFAAYLESYSPLAPVWVCDNCDAEVEIATEQERDIWNSLIPRDERKPLQDKDEAPGQRQDPHMGEHYGAREARTDKIGSDPAPIPVFRLPSEGA